MSNTPRTDEAEHQSDRSAAEYNYSYGFDYIGGLEIFALDGWEFARKLERENWRLRKESDFWVDLLVSNANSRFFSQEYTESSENSDD